MPLCSGDCRIPGSISRQGSPFQHTWSEFLLKARGCEVDLGGCKTVHPRRRKPESEGAGKSQADWDRGPERLNPPRQNCPGWGWGEPPPA